MAEYQMSFSAFVPGSVHCKIECVIRDMFYIAPSAIVSCTLLLLISEHLTDPHWTSPQTVSLWIYLL